MAASNKKFRIEDFWPHAVRRAAWESACDSAPLPRRSLQHDRWSCENWLLPPEQPTGIEAVLQSASTAAGPVLLLAAVVGGIWLVIG